MVSFLGKWEEFAREGGDATHRILKNKTPTILTELTMYNHSRSIIRRVLLCLSLRDSQSILGYFGGQAIIGAECFLAIQTMKERGSCVVGRVEGELIFDVFAVARAG